MLPGSKRKAVKAVTGLSADTVDPQLVATCRLSVKGLQGLFKKLIDTREMIPSEIN